MFMKIKDWYLAQSAPRQIIIGVVIVAAAVILIGAIVH